MGLYVEQLYEESLSEENYQAFEFLQTETEKLKEIAKNSEVPQSLVFEKMKSIVSELKRIYPNQVNVAEKLENFLISYENMQESLKN